VFGERVARLREEILKGKLDTIMAFDPTMILHGISGFSGEILPFIGWDPLNGETYTRFANDPFLARAPFTRGWRRKERSPVNHSKTSSISSNCARVLTTRQ